MLFEAAHLAEEGETSVQAAINHPQIAKYVRDWGKTTDLGFGAIDRTTHQKIGAAWLRLFPETDRGYGYINDRTPELVDCRFTRISRSRRGNPFAGSFTRCRKNFVSSRFTQCKKR